MSVPMLPVTLPLRGSLPLPARGEREGVSAGRLGSNSEMQMRQVLELSRFASRFPDDFF